jgi:hypothetical protein
MRAPILASLFVLVLASAAAQAAGGGIYQWKDAKGVTHYADTPPPASEYKQRSIHHPDPDQPATAAKPAENPACATARQNIALLNGHQNVQIDSDGDGKPDKALSADDRANQLALAQATLKTSCASGQ